MAKVLDNVRKLYLEGIRDGNARSAVQKYTGDRYTQHSTGVADGVEGFLAFFEPFVARNPDREIEIIRFIEDGQYVFCHAYQSLNGGSAKWVTTDLFDSDTNGLIVEHWDAISPYQDVTLSGEDMVAGPNEIIDLDKTNYNKAQVHEFVKQILQEKQFHLIDQFCADTCVTHFPKAKAGKEGLVSWFQSDEFGQYDMLFKLVGEGNFVATIGKTYAQGKENISFHIYRLEQGLIVECWDNVEAIAPRDQWNNSGKF
ncbi:nuclear transport factor 2 family protein [Marinomonas sp. 15G1-11]|uniref:Nuclear transport factor 2 family protein n=1 Tax=Marinomonas phaeophyticola TaxID=3004091 RepID=A0ABT4JZD2_9GAMM|nr:nuclear transport factor 2 family protein [Marinomonas sp. 15G1-11]MCZ2723452.1 nuclear transport factor 2 family protein [Marinomonas sp. 15G1-11]